MVAEHSCFTTDQVLSYLFADESPSKDEDSIEETLTEYVGIAL